MKEYLPLIIGIIWLAYTWYNKNQKKKQGKDNQPVSEKRAPSILEQLLTGENLQFSEPEPVYEDIEELDTNIQDNYFETELKTEAVKPSPFLSSERELVDFAEEGLSVFEDKYSLAPDEDETLVLDTLGELKDFDLRKAVIFSEILNAPYIDYK